MGVIFRPLLLQAGLPYAGCFRVGVVSCCIGYKDGELIESSFIIRLPIGVNGLPIVVAVAVVDELLVIGRNLSQRKTFVFLLV
jgi:hypothetical protein